MLNVIKTSDIWSIYSLYFSTFERMGFKTQLKVQPLWLHNGHKKVPENILELGVKALFIKKSKILVIVLFELVTCIKRAID